VATPNKINSNNEEKKNRHRQDGDATRVFSDVRQQPLTVDEKS
jgi:hypothetical protein